jgi:FAD-dependent urate hydroxylase
METNLLIVGAGPFGLAVAAQAAHDGIEHVVVGRPMEFWRRNMPKGMLLRSACDWHLDPLDVHTIEAYLREQGKTASEVEPLSLDFYLAYVDWFQKQKNIQPREVYIKRLDRSTENGRFVATTTDGERIIAKRVVLAPGFKHFANVPDELKAILPEGSFKHTADFVDFSDARNKRYLIIGGRQSAYEWTALLLEAGAASVHLSHRHASPTFEEADWTWVNLLVDSTVEDPSWFRRLSQSEKDAIGHRMWAEGRLKLETWIEPRIKDERVFIYPNTELATCTRDESGELTATLTNGATFNVDLIVLATGYRVNIFSLPYLAAGNLAKQLEVRNGFPVLDDHFETSIPGLFITSMPAAQDFGPFFGFTVSVRASAKLISHRLHGLST